MSTDALNTAPAQAAARLARWSAGLGIAGLAALVVFAPATLLFAVPGVVCGHKARRRFQALGEGTEGRRLASIGLVLGYLPIALVTATTIILSVLIVFTQSGSAPEWLSWVYALF